MQATIIFILIAVNICILLDLVDSIIEGGQDADDDWWEGK